MKPAEWLKEAGQTMSGLGRLVGKPATTVRKHVLGLRTPRPAEVASYYVVTGGRLDANSFFELPELPPEHALARAAMLEAEAAELRRRAEAAGCVA